MKFRRFAAGLASAMLVITALSLGAATSASAKSALTVGPGSTPGSLLVTYTPGAPWIIVTPARLNTPSCLHDDFTNSSGGTGSGMGYVMVDGSGTVEFSTMTEWWNDGPDVILVPGELYGVCDSYNAGLPVYGRAAGGPPDPAPIPPWVQSYGRGASSDACNDGWNPSWEQWPHNGQGGWVCTREIPSLG